MIERELTAAERRIELLVDIAMTPNHPDMITLSFDEAMRVYHARRYMAAWLFRVAIRLAPKGE
jgi:hypothetical protein